MGRLPPLASRRPVQGAAVLFFTSTRKTHAPTGQPRSLTLRVQSHPSSESSFFLRPKTHLIAGFFVKLIQCSVGSGTVEGGARISSSSRANGLDGGIRVES